MRINAAREQIAHGNMAAVFSLQKNFCKKWKVLSTYSGSQCIKSCLWLNDNKSLFWILVKTQKYISKFHNNYFSFDETVSLPMYLYLLASFINPAGIKWIFSLYWNLILQFLLQHQNISLHLHITYNVTSYVFWRFSYVLYYKQMFLQSFWQ